MILQPVDRTMTQEETRAFFAQYAKYRSKRSHRDALRKGQAMMVALAATRRDLHDRISGTTVDCFYDDSRIPAFRAWLGL